MEFGFSDYANMVTVLLAISAIFILMHRSTKVRKYFYKNSGLSNPSFVFLGHGFFIDKDQGKTYYSNGIIHKILSPSDIRKDNGRPYSACNKNGSHMDGSKFLINTRDPEHPVIQIDLFFTKNAQKCKNALTDFIENAANQNSNQKIHSMTGIENEDNNTSPEQTDHVSTKKKHEYIALQLEKFLDDNNFTKKDAHKDVRNSQLSKALEILYKNFEEIAGESYDSNHRHLILKAISPLFEREKGQSSEYGYMPTSLSTDTSNIINGFIAADKELKENNKKLKLPN